MKAYELKLSWLIKLYTKKYILYINKLLHVFIKLCFNKYTCISCFMLLSVLNLFSRYF